MNNGNNGPLPVTEIHATSPLNAAVQIIMRLDLCARDMLVLATSILAAVASTANKECPESSPFMALDMEQPPIPLAVAVLQIVEGLPCDCPACTAMKESIKNAMQEAANPANDTQH